LTGEDAGLQRKVLCPHGGICRHGSITGVVLSIEKDGVAEAGSFFVIMVQPTHLGTLLVAPSSSAAANSADSFLKKVLIYGFFAKVAARRIIELL
jgi:hypothetical protein